MTKSISAVALAGCIAAAFAEPVDGNAREAGAKQRNPDCSRSMERPLLAVHIDLKAGAFTRPAIERHLEVASKAGYNAVLWEVEDKVRWETCPAAAHPEAFSKDEFREILSTARRLGLRPVPLLQTCGHAAYMLRQKEYESLRERPLEKIGVHEDADSYCASNRQTREFLMRLIAEHLDLFGPDVREFHLGGDEAYSFGKCADCRSHDRGRLYVGHLDALAETLRARGVRPGIWCDMILASLGDAALSHLPKDFIVWHWDYAYGTTPRVMKWTHRLGEVAARGLDVVFAGASQCAGDDPFLVRQAFHRRNLAAVADYVRTNALYGMCVTSWSVREGAKRVQYPLWEFAAKRFLNPAADEQTDWEGVVGKWFGPVPADALDAVSEWSLDLRSMECRGRRRHFDPGRPVNPLRTFDPAKVRSDIEATRAQVRAGRSKLASANGPLGDTLREAAALKLAALDVFEARLDGKPDSSEGLYDAAERYYRNEETPASAKTSAHMLEPQKHGGQPR